MNDKIRLNSYHVQVENQLPQEDKMLKDGLDSFCVSNAERDFLEHMLEIEQHWLTEVGAPLILENENEDHLYIIHYYNNDYEVGNANGNSYEACSLHELLSLDLGAYDILNEHITVLDWLRKRNYKNVNYDRSFD